MEQDPATTPARDVVVGEDLGGAVVVAAGADTAVVAKPSGVAAEMRADTERRSLLGRVVAGPWPEARLPHRLDRVTAGLQVVCRDATAVERQNADVRDGRWGKTYVVRVAGADAEDHLLGEHRCYLRRRGRVAEVVRSGGQPARLTVRAVADDPERSDLAQVLVDLDTGRYHQIRAMLADLGAALVGDERYGGRPDDGGPWLEHARLGGIDLGGGPTTVRLPAHRRGFAYAAAIATEIEG